MRIVGTGRDLSLLEDVRGIEEFIISNFGKDATPGASRFVGTTRELSFNNQGGNIKRIA